MRQFPLTVIKDQYGHYPSGCVKMFPANEVQTLNYDWVVDADVENVDCEGKFDARAGRQGSNSVATPSTRVLQIKYREQHFWVLATKNQIKDLSSDCCLTGAAPGVTLAVDDSTVVVGTAVTLTATATDSDGTIAKVEFWEGDQKLGEDAATPFALTTALPVGTHYIVAKAIDNDGNVAYSNFVAVYVSAA